MHVTECARVRRRRRRHRRVPARARSLERAEDPRRRVNLNVAQIQPRARPRKWFLREEPFGRLREINRERRARRKRSFIQVLINQRYWTLS